MNQQVTADPIGQNQFQASIERIVAGQKDNRNGPSAPLRIETGVNAIDRYTGGIRAGTVTVIAGYPEMGQHALAVSIASHVGRHAPPGPVDDDRTCTLALAKAAYFCPSQPAARVVSEMLAIETGFPWLRIYEGLLNEAERQQLSETSRIVAKRPIYMDDMPEPKIDVVCKNLLRLKHERSPELIIIDGLRSADETAHSETTAQAPSARQTVQTLIALARRTNAAVIVVADMPPPEADRVAPAPPPSVETHLSLLELGTDADMVLICHREEYELERLRPQNERQNDREGRWQRRLGEVKGLMTLEIVKNNVGPLGCLDLLFDHSTLRFAGTNSGNNA